MTTEVQNPSESVSQVPAASGALVPSLSEQAAALATKTHIFVAGGSYRVKAQITRTVLRQMEGKPFAVRFEAAAYESESLKDEAAKGREASRKPPRVAHVINLETGDKQVLIMNTVLEGELERAFPKAGYVGRDFLIRGEVPVGRDGKLKTYRVYQIIEIEREDGVNVARPVADGTDPVNAKGEAPASKPKK